MQVTIVSETKTVTNQLERKKDDFKLRTDTIETLRTAYKDKEFALDNIDTQILLMGHEIITKEGERNRLQQELEERKQQELDMVQPRINELSSDIEMYTSDIVNKGKRLNSCKDERTKLTDNIESLKFEIDKLEKEVDELTKDANEKKSDPASYEQ
jgi:chromosome segregation ATPase